MARILIIDDEKTISTAISFGLKKNQHEIVDAVQPSEILNLLNENKFDLLILDYNLPILSGNDIVKLIQNHSIEIPIVIISSQNINSSEFSELSKFNFISKDQPISTIITKIEETLMLINHNHYLGGSYAQN